MCSPTRVLAIAVTIVFLTLPAPARADVIFSNLGPGDSYNCCSGWTLFGSDLPIDTDRAFAFTPAADYTLDSIDLALTWLGGTNAADVWLMSDEGGAPGSILESFLISSLPTFNTTNTLLTTADSTLNPLLSAGVQYWVASSAHSADGSLSFNWNITGDEGLASRDNGGPWGVSTSFLTSGAFRVNGTPAAPVPEPSSVLLLAAGVLGLLSRTRRKNKRDIASRMRAGVGNCIAESRLREGRLGR
jgi:hypothetical protein